MPRLIVFTFIFLITGTGLFSQATARASAAATIVVPVGTEKSGDMSFGYFTTDGRAGSVKLDVDGVRTVSGKIKLQQGSEGFEVASFNIIGNALTYSVTLPPDPVIVKRNAGLETMKVNSFTVKSSTKSSLNINSEAFTIGAILSIGAHQAAGHYISDTPFIVTVNFN